MRYVNISDIEREIGKTLRLDYASNPTRFAAMLGVISRAIDDKSISPAEKAWLSEKETELLELRRPAEMPRYL
jgi:hypothetical protein